MRVFIEIVASTLSHFADQMVCSRQLLDFPRKNNHDREETMKKVAEKSRGIQAKEFGEPLVKVVFQPLKKPTGDNQVERHPALRKRKNPLLRKL